MLIFSVDPGMTGAWALIENGRPTLCGDMPTAGEGSQRRVQGSVLAQVMADADLCVIEETSARPDQGVSSMYRFGRAVGVVEGVAGALRVPIEYATPQVWKRAFRLTGKEKEASRAKALALAPQLAEHLRRKKDHGRAEAVLIGLYGWQTWGSARVAA